MCVHVHDAQHNLVLEVYGYRGVDCARWSPIWASQGPIWAYFTPRTLDGEE